MALIGNITDKSTGIVCNYHVIDYLSGKHSLNNNIQYILLSYLNETQRNSGKKPVIITKINISLNDSYYTNYLAESVVSGAGETSLKKLYQITKSLDGTQNEQTTFGRLCGVDFTQFTDA